MADRRAAETVTAVAEVDEDVRNIERLVTVVIPNVLVLFDDVGDDYDEGSAAEAAVDLVINELEEVRAGFVIQDVDGRDVKRASGTITKLRWGPGRLMISPIVKLDDELSTAPSRQFGSRDSP